MRMMEAGQCLAVAGARRLGSSPGRPGGYFGLSGSSSLTTLPSLSVRLTAL